MNNVKKFIFGEMEWEVVFMEGKPYFLLKDLLKYFDYKPSSQGAFIDNVKNRNKMKLNGDHREITQQLTHISAGRGWIVSQEGVKDYTRFKKGEKQHQPGILLLNWIKTVHMQKEFKQKPEQIDLVDFINEEEIIALKKVVINQSERIDALEKRVQALEQQIKDGMTHGMIQEEKGKKVIDADALINYLQKTGVTGNV